MSIRTCWKTVAAAAAAVLLCLGASGTQAGGKRLNVLMVAVDDLKPTFGAYGHSWVRSPNLDRLAASGVTFTRAFCMQAVCSPSRNALLSGLRPDTIGIYDLATHLRSKVPNVVTLPQHFKQNGYHSEGMGKIFHIGQGNYDDLHSWSIPSWPEDRRGPLPGTGVAPPLPRRQMPPRGPAFRAPEVPDNELQDGKIADHAIERLKTLKQEGKPFFMAVGFHKPHLPFVAPKKYWDLYDPQKLPLAELKELPEGAPRFAGTGWGELRTYRNIPKQGPIPDDLARQLVHGYYASVSYMDAQLGRILDELDRSGLRENTIVALWGDHGWHLGDHGMWCKHTNFEQAANAPLIVSAPGINTRGQKTAALTEFVDVYPSLCELAGLPKPAALEGVSFVPLLRDPQRKWKSAAFHQYPRNIPGQGQGMGRSIRTERYRLTEWTVPGKDFSAVELYDLQNDPAERANLAARPEHAQTVADLKTKLHAGWKAAAPR